MEQTSGDFIGICDADTRLFPAILDHTLGYFRNPGVALVQTPQWFYDIPGGERLQDVWACHVGTSCIEAALDSQTPAADAKEWPAA